MTQICIIKRINLYQKTGIKLFPALQNLYNSYINTIDFLGRNKCNSRDRILP